jgi:hypothetical protein
MKQTAAGMRVLPAISSPCLMLHHGRPGGLASDLEKIIRKLVDGLGLRRVSCQVRPCAHPVSMPLCAHRHRFGRGRWQQQAMQTENEISHLAAKSWMD